MTSLVLNAVEHHARNIPSRAALSGDARTLNYVDLNEAITDTAARIDRVAPTTCTIAVEMDNIPAWVIVDLAIMRLGHRSLPIPFFFTPAQRGNAISQSGAALLFTDRLLPEPTIANFTVEDTIIFVYDLPRLSVTLPYGTAKITFTSGTSAQAKGVCHSREGLERVAMSLVEALGVEYAGIHLAILPLSVLLENVAGLYTTLIAGGHYYVLPQASIGFAKPFTPDFHRLTEALGAAKATSAIVVPEILRGILADLTANHSSLPDMKLLAVGGARVSSSLLASAASLGLPVFQGYGLTEAGSVVALNSPAHNHAGSVGKPLAHIALEIADDDTVVIQDPAFLGYLGSPAPQPTFRTGDIGHLDADGFLYIDGRQSNVLITAYGRNIAPEWVESELQAQAGVSQAFVFGDGAPGLGALLVPSSLNVTTRDLGDAIARANAALPEYAHVLHWSQVLPFAPMNGLATSNGRLRRDAIAKAHSTLMNRVLSAPGYHEDFFARLVRETEGERQSFVSIPQIRDGLAGKISLDTYRAYLAQAYHHVKHTTSLMACAAERIPPSKEWLNAALAEYVAEEIGHEEWILDDIRGCGGNPDAVRISEPSFATELMVSYAYDYVTRKNPVGFFGMVFVLEGTSTQLATRGAHALMQSLNLDEHCFHYLLSHGTLDLSHMVFFQNLVNRIDDEDDRRAIVHMARAMYRLFGDVFRSIPHRIAGRA